MLVVCVSQNIAAQKRVSTYDLVTKNKLTYIKTTGELFTGIAESRKKNGHLILDESITDGYKTKYTVYYNTDVEAISSEIYYYENSFIEKLRIEYSLDHKDRRIIHYDNNGKKKFAETYYDENLIYSCEYNNGKKNGKEFCITKKCGDNTEFYDNGKKVKI